MDTGRQTSKGRIYKKNKTATSDRTVEKRRLMHEQRKENEVDGDALYSIHHDAFK